MTEKKELAKFYNNYYQLLYFNRKRIMNSQMDTGKKLKEISLGKEQDWETEDVDF